MRKLIFLMVVLGAAVVSAPAQARAATLTLSPTSGPAGTQVTATGFGKKKAGTITFGTTQVATFTTAANQSFSKAFTVPSGYSGATAVRATVTTTSATATFNVTAAPPTGLQWLHTQGNRILSSTGADVVLRGANILESEWMNGACDGAGHYQDANGLACDSFPINTSWEDSAVPALTGTWGGDVVVHGFASDPVNQDNAAYLAILDRYVSLTASHSAYIVLAWRSYAQNDVQPNQPDTSPYTGPSAWGSGAGTGATAALAKLAARYRGDPHVIFALQVEPHDVSWSTVRPVFEAMVDQIRQASAPYEQIILVPGIGWSRDISGAATDPVNRPDIVYKTHPYDSATNFQADFGNTYDAGRPVFIGEFGPTAYMSMSDVAALLDRARQQGLGWAAWGFEPDANPALVTSTLTPTNPYGTTVQAWRSLDDRTRSTSRRAPRARRAHGRRSARTRLRELRAARSARRPH
jgi:hypothetical protein